MERKRVGRVENRAHINFNIDASATHKPQHDHSTAEFLRHARRRGSMALTKVKEISILWGGGLVLQTVIGPGIFTSPKGVLHFGGSIGASLVIWAWSGIISTFAALCFVELQLSVPRAGCEYGYIHKAFGKVPTFIYTWMRIALAEPVTTAVFTIAFGDYVADTIFDNCGPSDLIRKMFSVLAVVFLTILNGHFKSVAENMNFLANIGKFITLSIVICVGLYRLSTGHVTVLREGFKHTQQSYESLTYALLNSLWAYGGWANVPQVTAGVRRPPKSMPFLILTVIPFVSCVYMLMVTSLFTVLSRDDMLHAEAIAVKWAENSGLGSFGIVIPISVCFIALGNANGTFMAAGRTASVAVHDGFIPEILSYVHVKTKIHIPAVAWRCAAAIFLIFLTDVGSLVRFYVFTVWLFHGVTVLGLFVLRWKKQYYFKPYKVPTLIPVTVVLFSAALVVIPFTSGKLPRKEFLFSVAVAVLSIIGFFPFGNAKPLLKFMDWFVIFAQMIFNVIPPNIQRHKQSRNLRRKRKFTPASVKLTESFRKPGRFSVTSQDGPLPETDKEKENAQTKAARMRRLYREMDDPDRRISVMSITSIDYCEVMNEFDEAAGNYDTDSLTLSSSGSTDTAYSAGRTSVSSTTSDVFDDPPTPTSPKPISPLAL